MSDRRPSFDDVIDYRRRRLVEALARLESGEQGAARDEADRLLLDYVGDDLIRAAFEQAVRRADT